jgi:hypothetical protein
LASSKFSKSIFIQASEHTAKIYGSSKERALLMTESKLNWLLFNSLCNIHNHGRY